ncbi:hypothetical protein OSB04_un000909 [Centaurea solstitialis]|uniref:Reverse transcriptase zinc-binding domain-containing protein n=1 Tax=Centaurea solstitialis TaxID=347529 RepID=A0AA38S5C0_9ASTR|nr:hypothetical protein OSB04_un000909 [Centaurea solstitialis]
MMGIRSEIRRFVRVRIRNGQTANAWEDNWLSCGPLSGFVTTRFIHGRGLSVTTTVRQLLDTFHDGWPDLWTTTFSILESVDLPMIVHDSDDVVCWDAAQNGDFSVHQVYESLIGHLELVAWTSSVWFKGHIPKHSFCMWVACLHRLPTQDRIAEWKHEPPDLLCSLCGLVRDSHDHLFFECTFSRQVWLKIMDEVDWFDFPCSWSAIVDALTEADTAPKSLTHQLALAASVYFVWSERNQRLFTDKRNPVPYIVQQILSTVFDRVAWKHRKKLNSPDGDVQSVEVLKKALSIFEAKSGLSANLDKSEVFFGNVPLDTWNAIRTCLPFRNGIFPIRYLGVPLSPVRLKRSDYGTLILKVKNRIQNWKAKFLSFGGRMQLINSVLHSLQLYWMGVFNFPAAVIHEIEGLFRSFLWHQDVMGRGNCRVAWDMVCKPKANGGLGFKRLGWWNKALLAQHLWDLATKRESLWVRWVLCDAFKGANMWIALADLGEAFQGHWPVTWINRFDQLSNIAFPALEDTRDAISWLDDANPVEDFKVSMAYKAIQGEQMEVPWHRMVWFKGCIPKHAFCLWLACWRRLPTQDRMMAWKEEPPDYSCSLCKSCVDSHSHLFFMCSFANEVWKEVTLAIGWQNAPMAWDDMLLLMSDQATAPKRLIRNLLFRPRFMRYGLKGINGYSRRSDALRFKLQS